MDFFNQEVNVDVVHLFLFAGLLFLIFYVVKYCGKCGGGVRPGAYGGVEGLDLPRIKPVVCKCPSCSEACYQRLLNDQFYGSAQDNAGYLPKSDMEANLQYHKCNLSCGVA